MTHLDNDDFTASLILFVQEMIIKIKLLIKITQGDLSQAALSLNKIFINTDGAEVFAMLSNSLG